MIISKGYHYESEMIFTLWQVSRRDNLPEHFSHLEEIHLLITVNIRHIKKLLRGDAVLHEQSLEVVDCILLGIAEVFIF